MHIPPWLPPSPNHSLRVASPKPPLRRCGPRFHCDVISFSRSCNGGTYHTTSLLSLAAYACFELRRSCACCSVPASAWTRLCNGNGNVGDVAIGIQSMHGCCYCVSGSF